MFYSGTFFLLAHDGPRHSLFWFLSEISQECRSPGRLELLPSIDIIIITALLNVITACLHYSLHSSFYPVSPPYCPNTLLQELIGFCVLSSLAMVNSAAASLLLQTCITPFPQRTCFQGVSVKTPRKLLITI